LGDSAHERRYFQPLGDTERKLTFDLRLYCDRNLFRDVLAKKKTSQTLLAARLLELPG
jgi:hypothetical protein